MYKDKDVVWGNSKNGKTNGAVVISSNTKDPKTYKPLVTDIDGVKGLASEANLIYYVDTANKIHRAKHTEGKFVIDVVHEKIANIQNIAVLDKYIYINDPTGIRVLKTSSDKSTKGYAAEAKQLHLGKIDNVQAFTIFRAGAYYLSAMFGTLIMVVSLTFF